MHSVEILSPEVRPLNFHSSASYLNPRLLVYIEENTLLYKIDKSLHREYNCVPRKVEEDGNPFYCFPYTYLEKF